MSFTANTARTFKVGTRKNYTLDDGGNPILPRSTTCWKRQRLTSQAQTVPGDIAVLETVGEDIRQGEEEAAVESGAVLEERIRGTAERWVAMYGEPAEDGEDDVSRNSIEDERLSSNGQAFLLLDLLKWKKFKRTKVELEFDLQTTKCCLSTNRTSNGSDIAFPVSVYRVLKLYGANSRRMQIQYVCPEHKRIVGSLNVNEPLKGVVFRCGTVEEGHELPATSLHQSCFLTTSIEDGLKRVLRTSGSKVLQILDKRFEVLNQPPLPTERRKTIYGEYYRRLKLGRHDLTLMVHSDGAEMSDSSSLKVYAVHWSLMELSEEEQCENIVLSALWIGPNANFPHRKVLFHNFMQEMDRLSTAGLKWSVGNTEIMSRVFVSVVPCDSQERWPLAGLSSFHNVFGCTMCNVQATDWQDPHNARSHKKVYLSSNVAGLDRNDKTVNRLATKIMRLDKILRETARLDPEYKGVQESSVLSSLQKFDLIVGLPPDILHQFFKGVIREVLDNFELSKRDREVIDSCSARLDIPSCFSRKPRTWEERSRFKANEYRDILFVGTPMLKPVLAPQDFSLWLLLVSVGLTVTKDVIDESDIASLEKECPLLVRNLRLRFGDGFMVYNMHQILHFPRYVRLLGNMAQYCTFAYEDAIGKLMSTIKGFYNGCREIARTIMLEDIIDFLSNDIDVSSTEKPVLELLDRSSRTVYRTDAVKSADCYLFRKLKSLHSFRQSDIASWTSLYFFVESLNKISEPGNLCGNLFESFSLRRFNISTRPSRSDHHANSVIHVNGQVLRVRHIVNVDDVLPVMICQMSRTLEERPYQQFWHLPTLLRIEWLSNIVCCSVTDFTGSVVEYPEIPETSPFRTVCLLPIHLYQVD